MLLVLTCKAFDLATSLTRALIANKTDWRPNPPQEPDTYAWDLYCRYRARTRQASAIERITTDQHTDTDSTQGVWCDAGASYSANVARLLAGDSHACGENAMALRIDEATSELTRTFAPAPGAEPHPMGDVYASYLVEELAADGVGARNVGRFFSSCFGDRETPSPARIVVDLCWTAAV